jgi:MFS family permease
MSGEETLRRLWVLMSIAFIDMVGTLMIIPLLPFYAKRMGGDAITVGLLVSCFSAAQLLTSPWWGRLSDRYGRRPVLMVALFASAVAYAIFAFADSIWLLFLSRLVQGAGGGTTGVVQAYVGDSIEPENRAKALGWVSSVTNAGVAIGPAIASLTVPLGPHVPGLLASGLCLVNVAWAYRSLPESSQHVGVVRERRSVRGAMVELLKHPGAPVSLLILIYAGGMLAFSALTGVLALYLAQAFGVTEKTSGYFYTYVGVLSVVMRSIFLGPVIHRLGEVRTLRLGAVALVVGFGLLPFAHTVWLFAVVVALLPIGTALLFPPTSSLVSRFAPAAEMGQTLGLQQAFGGVSRMIGPTLAGVAFAKITPGAPFALSSVLMVGVLALGVRLRRSHARPTPEAVIAPS